MLRERTLSPSVVWITHDGSSDFYELVSRIGWLTSPAAAVRPAETKSTVHLSFGNSMTVRIRKRTPKQATKRDPLVLPGKRRTKVAREAKNEGCPPLNSPLRLAVGPRAISSRWWRRAPSFRVRPPTGAQTTGVASAPALAPSAPTATRTGAGWAQVGAAPAVA